jgi:hypothetical protein
MIFQWNKLAAFNVLVISLLITIYVALSTEHSSYVAFRL